MPAHAEAETLLQDPELQQSAVSLQQCATKLGIVVPNETATCMLERWLYAERAHRLLKASGLDATLGKLRVPAPAGATRVAPAPVQQGPLAPCGRTGPPIQCAGVGVPVVATAASKPPAAVASTTPQVGGAAAGAAAAAAAAGAARAKAKVLQRKRCRRVASARGKKIRKGSLDKWKADDPEYDYDAAIAGSTAARVPGADPSTVDL